LGSGSDGAACSEADPCSIARAVAVVTPSLNTIFMEPGTYDSVVIDSGATMTFLGNGSTITAEVSVSHASTVAMQDLTIGGPFSCTDSVGPDSQVTLTRVGLNAAFSLTYCQLALMQTNIAGGATSQMSIDATLTADRSTLPEVLPANGITGSITVTNSILDGGMSNPISGSATNNFTVDVSYSTQWYSEAVCPKPMTGLSYRMSNCIVAGPADLGIAAAGSDNCFDHVMAFPMNTGSIPAGVIVADPMMVDPTDGDFHLMPSSSAINAADSSISDDHDYDGVSRPQGAGPDIGAFEFH
jgi:hypothetical protein